MIRALKEYYETVAKPARKWCRKHWKGYTVFAAICIAAPLLYLYGYDIYAVKEYIKDKFKKNEEES